PGLGKNVALCTIGCAQRHIHTFQTEAWGTKGTGGAGGGPVGRGGQPTGVARIRNTQLAKVRRDGRPGTRGRGLTGEDLAQLAGDAVRVPVKGRLEVAALVRGGIR